MPNQERPPPASVAAPPGRTAVGAVAGVPAGWTGTRRRRPGRPRRAATVKAVMEARRSSATGIQIAGIAHIGQSLADRVQSIRMAATPMPTPCHRTAIAAFT